MGRSRFKFRLSRVKPATVGRELPACDFPAAPLRSAIISSGISISAFREEETGHDASWRRRLSVRADPRFSETAAGRVVRHGQPGGDRRAGPGLCVSAQGPADRRVRPRRQISRRLGQRRGDRPARAEDRRRHRLHDRPHRLGREIVHARRQAADGAGPARRAFRHRQGRRTGSSSAPPGRSTIRPR